MARLEASGITALALDGSEGVYLESFDLGFPDVRDTSGVRVDQDGEDDTTSLFGGRVVELQVAAVADFGLADAVDRLSAFLRPSLRPWFYFQRAGQDERRIRLRVSQFSSPVTNPALQRAQVQFRAPDGIIEAADETIVSVYAGSDTEEGVAFPVVFPFSWPATAPAGTTTVTNEGNVAVAPILRLYGPCVDPVLENVTAGESFEFTANGGITLAAGEYLEVDVLERTVRLNGESDQSRYSRLDFASSSWWRLEPGANEVRFDPASFTSGAHAEVRYRDSWI